MQQQPGMMMQPGMQQPGMMMQPGMQQPMMMQPGMQQPMMMQQPVMMQPVVMLQPGMQMQAGGATFQVVQVKWGMEKLQEMPGVFVKQKFQLMEALTGCEQENKYAVYKLSKDGKDKKGKPFLKAKEKSGFCARQCCPAAMRPFHMIVENEDNNETVDGEKFMHIERPFTCAILCCCRPFAEATLNEKEVNERLGTIKNPWTCYDVQMDVHGPSDELKYKIVGNCCQLGFWCKWPCDPCQHIHFDIRDPAGTVVGNLEKFSQGCIKASIDDSSNFSIEFPKDTTPKDKALFIAATLFMDLRFFEEKPDRNGPQL